MTMKQNEVKHVTRLVSLSIKLAIEKNKRIIFQKYFK